MVCNNTTVTYISYGSVTSPRQSFCFVHDIWYRMCTYDTVELDTVQIGYTLLFVVAKLNLKVSVRVNIMLVFKQNFFDKIEMSSILFGQPSILCVICKENILHMSLQVFLSFPFSFCKSITLNLYINNIEYTYILYITAGWLYIVQIYKRFELSFFLNFL